MSNGKITTSATPLRTLQTEGLLPAGKRTLSNFRMRYPKYSDWDDSKILYAIKKKYPKYAGWKDDKLIYALENKYSQPETATIPDSPDVATPDSPHLTTQEEGYSGFDPTLVFKSAITGGPETAGMHLRGLTTKTPGTIPALTATGIQPKELEFQKKLDDALLDAADWLDKLPSKISKEEYAKIQQAETGSILPQLGKDIKSWPKEINKSFNKLQVAFGRNLATMMSARGAQKLAGGGPAGILASTVAMANQEAGSFVKVGNELGIDKDIVEKWAERYGAVAGPVESLQQLYNIAQYGKDETAKEVAKKMLPQLLKKLAKSKAGKILAGILGATSEGLEEVIQGGANTWMVNRAIDEMRERNGLTPEQLPYITSDLWEDFLVGTAIGGTHTMLGAGYKKVFGKDDVEAGEQPVQPEPPTEPEAPIDAEQIIKETEEPTPEEAMPEKPVEKEVEHDVEEPEGKEAPTVDQGILQKINEKQEQLDGSRSLRSELTLPMESKEAAEIASQAIEATGRKTEVFQSIEDNGWRLTTHLEKTKKTKTEEARVDRETQTVRESTYKAGTEIAEKEAIIPSDYNILISEPSKTEPKDRVVLTQISNNILSEKTDQGKDYYDKLYSGTRIGYERPGETELSSPDFWEVPTWIAEAKKSLGDKADILVVRNPQKVADYIVKNNIKSIAFSVLDTNKDQVKEIVNNLPSDVTVHIGGYIDNPSGFFDAKNNANIVIHDDMGSFVEAEGAKRSAGYDYAAFKDSKTIPRLCLSRGCKHHCVFCDVTPHGRVEALSDKEISDQIDNIVDLDFSLAYLDDKTFGQSDNYKKLPEIYNEIIKRKPDFDGFIIQTTPSVMNSKKFSKDFLEKAGIRYVELGVETYNEPLLKIFRKPATLKLIDDSVNWIRENNLSFIPNVIVGGHWTQDMVESTIKKYGKSMSAADLELLNNLEETEESYKNTLDFLKRNSDIISHINLYNYAPYADTIIGEKIKAEDKDLLEGVIEKSFHKNPTIHAKAFNAFKNYALKALDKQPSGTVSASEFNEALNVALASEKLAGHADEITGYSEQELKDKGAKLYLTHDKRAGYGITDDGELINLFSSEYKRGKGLVEDAIKNGAKHLNATEGYLTDFYGQYFELVRKEANYDKELPDVWYMSLTSETKKSILQEEGKIDVKQKRKIQRTSEKVRPETQQRVSGKAQGPTRKGVELPGAERTPERPSGRKLEPSPKPKPDKISQKTSARQLDLASDRVAMGLSEINSKNVLTFKKALLEARKQNVPENALRIATVVNKSPRALTPVEKAGMVERAAQLKNEYKQLSRKANDTVDPVELSGIIAEANRVEEEFDAISKAVYVSGSEAGRGLVFQKITLDDTYDLLSVKSRAKVAKKTELTQKEVQTFEKLTTELDNKNAMIEKMRLQIKELKSKSILKKGVTKRYKHMSESQKDTELTDLVNKLKEMRDC